MLQQAQGALSAREAELRAAQQGLDTGEAQRKQVSGRW